MFKAAPAVQQNYWTSFIHTFSTGSVQWEAGAHPGLAERADQVCIGNMRSILPARVGKHTLRLDREPVTSNGCKTQLCFNQAAHPFTFFYSLIHSSLNLF